MKPDQSPISYQEFEKRMSVWRDRPLILTRGMYAPAPGTSRRYLLFTRDEQQLTERMDVWGPPDALETIDEWARDYNIQTARCDAMYATPVELLWFTSQEEFFLYKAEGRGPLQLSYTLRPGGTSTAVECYLSKDWVIRGVGLAEPDNTLTILAEVSEPVATFDPTYDALDLMGDAGWVLDLGQDVAKFLNIPLHAHPDLR